MMLTLFNLLDKHQLTQKSDFDYDGVSDVEECPALKILLLDIKKEGIGDLGQIGDLDSKININPQNKRNVWSLWRKYGSR